MFSLFRRKTSLDRAATFKSKVEHFWDWFATQASKFDEIIESKSTRGLAEAINPKVDEVTPQVAWVFGPGPNDKGHSLTLSGEGVPHLQLLTAYWCARAPVIDRWTFHPSRQPSASIEGFQLGMGGRTFDPIAFWLTLHVDAENEKVDLTAWHPFLDQIDEQHRFAPLFLVLDEVLGEFGTQNLVGTVKLNNTRLSDAIPLKELPDSLARIVRENGWKKFPPTETWTGYSCPNPHTRFPRGDTIAGTTCHPDLIQDYLKAEGELADPIAGSGADFVFVRFDAACLPSGKQVEARGAIEESVEAALSEHATGRFLGGALGTEFAYIDLLLCDGRTSLQIVREALQRHPLPRGSIEYFAKEKRGHRLILYPAI
jgi:hypothetical protein